MLQDKTKYCFWLLILISTVSCEREIEDVKLPEFVQKLVISSFISPSDTVSYITVSSNRRIFGELNINESTGNLTAYLSDGSREIKLDTTKSGFKFFPENMHIKEGKTYTLRVLSDKGISAEASCTVPFSRKIEIEVDTFWRVESHPGMPDFKNLMADIFLNDYEGEDNYYRIFGEQETYDKRFMHSPDVYQFYELGEKGFNDNGWDGKRSLINTIDITNPIPYDSSFLRFYILFTDKAYYTYHQSLDNYSNDENPFSENSPVFSNITGGLGIFSAYTSDTVIVRLK
ncbi:MAG: DUF4249 domain-containing protein [Bacteroidia bacterium]|nr:DUF4249 domain-containing protein [Bacteroidia bacterium]